MCDPMPVDDRHLLRDRVPDRSSSFGQDRRPTAVDRFGVWLSGAAVRRHADPDGALAEIIRRYRTGEATVDSLLE